MCRIVPTWYGHLHSEQSRCEAVHCLGAVGREVVSEFNVQHSANMACAFAFPHCRDEKAFAVASKLHVQDCADMAWTLA
jgi:hypothetical protein